MVQTVETPVKKNKLPFFRYSNISELEQQIRGFDYFAKAPFNKVFCKNLDLDYESLCAAVHVSHDPQQTASIGIWGRMLMLTALLGPISKDRWQLDVVYSSLLGFAKSESDRDDVNEDVRLSKARQSETIQRLISRRVIGEKPKIYGASVPDKDQVLCCVQTLQDSACVHWAIDVVVDVACDPDRRAATVPGHDEDALRQTLRECLFLDHQVDGLPKNPRPYAQPIDLFLALTDAIGLVRDPADAAETAPKVRPKPRAFVQPGLAQYASKASNKPRSSDVNVIVKTVISSLEHDEPDTLDRSKLIVLWGKEQTGKKSVVGDLLRKIRRDDGADPDYRFDIRGPENAVVRTLPVFAVVVHREPYRDLLTHLFVMLSLHRPVVEDDDDNDGSATAPIMDKAALQAEARHLLDIRPNARALIDAIDELHQKVPAFFIFSDIHGVNRDGMQTILNENSVATLLGRLTNGSQSKSRFLITQETNSWKDWDREPKDLTPRIIEMPLPKLERFVWYPDETGVERFQGPQFDDLRRAAKTQPEELEGNGLMIMSALLAMDDRIGVVHDAFKHYALGPTDGTPKPSLAARYSALTQSFLLCLRRNKLDDVILLIAATTLTDDWLSETTLQRMLTKWRDLYDQPDWSWESVQQGLERLKTGTQSLYLSRSEKVSFDPDELSYTEKNNATTAEWRMSRSLALDLVKYGQDLPNVSKTIRSAFRLVAAEAHTRAQNKRLRRRQSGGSRRELARDIQCVQALLASLPKSFDPGGDLDCAPFGSLRMRTMTVFAPDPDVEPSLVLRYAVLLMLRLDIDPDHKLSMVTDQDELRLSIYLRLFMPLGEMQLVQVRELRKERVRASLPESVPDHLKAALRPCEILGLLVSISIAAYHSQLEEVVAWAKEVADELFDDIGDAVDARCRSFYSRIQNVRVDAAVSQGLRDSPAKRGPDPAPGLTEVWTDLRDDWLVWCDAYLADGAGPEDGVLRALQDQLKTGTIAPVSVRKAQEELNLPTPHQGRKAMALADGLRLLARVAETDWMVHNPDHRSKAGWDGSFYQTIVDLEHFAARQRGDDDSPVAMGGRSGSRLIRALTGDPLVLAGPPTLPNPVMPDDQLRFVSMIVETNIARLGRYSGADRLYSLLDCARLEFARLDPQTARVILDDCVASIDDSLISAQGRLEIQANDHGLQLQIWGAGLVDGAVDIDADALNDRQNRLLKMADEADKLALYPLLCGIRLLLGRLYVIQGQTQSYDLMVQDQARNEFALCQGLSESIGFAPAWDVAAQWLAYLDIPPRATLL